jgi:hypothetical protein
MKSYKQFLTKKKEQKVIVVYPGRFQPFHSSHFQKYQYLVSEFGEENVVIATSDKTDPEKSPFNFKQKKKIIQKMFGVKSDKIIQVKNPYSPVEVLDNYPEDTVYITAVGKKDSDRLGGKYYQKYNPNAKMKGYKDAGYVLILPEDVIKHNGEVLSGTVVRETFKNAKEKDKVSLFTSLYGNFDKEIFELISKGIK